MLITNSDNNGDDGFDVNDNDDFKVYLLAFLSKQSLMLNFWLRMNLSQMNILLDIDNLKDISHLWTSKGA